MRLHGIFFAALVFLLCLLATLAGQRSHAAPGGPQAVIYYSDGVKILKDKIYRADGSLAAAPAASSELAQGRCTLTTATPVTTADVTAATTIYFTPYGGNKIGLYDGTNWVLHTFTEKSLAVPATTNTMYDLYMYNNSGTLTLEATAWTDDTTRATALVKQDGVYVKTGATTRRYVCSFRTTGASGQTEDSLAKRYVWNYYNRVTRPVRVLETTDTWAYSTATWRQANGAAGNQVDIVVGVAEDMLRLTALGSFSTSTATPRFGMVGIGVDSTSANSATITSGSTGTNTSFATPFAVYSAIPTAGRHYYAWLEIADAAGTLTWYGDNTASAATQPIQTGLVGEVQN